MPLPVPNKDEERSHFIDRCVSFETKASPGRPSSQILAMCYNRWRTKGNNGERGGDRGGPRKRPLRIDKGDVRLTVSNKSWASIDKSKLPASCFLWVGDPNKKSTWHLPVYEKSTNGGRGHLNLNALRAAAAAIAGARTGKAMAIPASVRAKLTGLLKRYKMGEYKGT